MRIQQLNLTILLVIFSFNTVWAQTIDFEELPSGDATISPIPISDQYRQALSGGVSFSILDENFNYLSDPVIARVDQPGTNQGPIPNAFTGTGQSYDGPAPCNMSDSSVSNRPDSDYSAIIKCAFLTYPSSLTTEQRKGARLLISYDNAVDAATGVIIDVDSVIRSGGNIDAEIWRVSAYDVAAPSATDTPITDDVIICAQDTPNQAAFGCASDIDVGNGVASEFLISAANIRSIVISYDRSSTATSSYRPGLAFDEFTPNRPVVIEEDIDDGANVNCCSAGVQACCHDSCCGRTQTNELHTWLTIAVILALVIGLILGLQIAILLRRSER